MAPDRAKLQIAPKCSPPQPKKWFKKTNQHLHIYFLLRKASPALLTWKTSVTIHADPLPVRKRLLRVTCVSRKGRHDTPRQTSQLVVALQNAIHGKLLALVVGAENSKSIFGDFSKLKVDCRRFQKLKVDFRFDFASFSNSKSTFDEAFALLSPEQICRFSDRFSVQKSRRF